MSYPKRIRPDDGEALTREDGTKIIAFYHVLDGPIFYEAAVWIKHLEREAVDAADTIARLR